MARQTLLWVLTLVFIMGCGGTSDEPQEPSSADVYTAGEPLGTITAADLSVVLERPESFADQTVRLEGTLDEVCQKKGCWMILRDGDSTVRVTFKDYGFFVPTDTKPGSIARIDAVVQRETMSEETARHYESETEGGDPDSITGPVEVVSVVALGVEIDR